MRTEQYWDDLKKECEELKKQRTKLRYELKDINDRIQVINTMLNAKEREQGKSVEQSIAYQMFGKQFKELNAREKREYFNARYNAYKERNKAQL